MSNWSGKNTYYFKAAYSFLPSRFFFGGGDNSPNKMQTLFEFNLDGLTHIKHKIAEFLPSLVLSKKI